MVVDIFQSIHTSVFVHSMDALAATPVLTIQDEEFPHMLQLLVCT